MQKGEIVPMSLSDAQEFVRIYHRHHKPPIGHKFSIGFSINGDIVGVEVVESPKARGANDGRTLEITRICTTDWTPSNVVSKMTSAVLKAAFALGYKKVITYILESEDGSSIKASGFRFDKIVRGRSWSTPSRLRVDSHPLDNKKRFSITPR